MQSRFGKKTNFFPKALSRKNAQRSFAGWYIETEKSLPFRLLLSKIMPRFRCRMAMYRCAASPSFRRSPCSLQVTNESRELMEQWSLEHPEEGVMGLAAAIESKLLARHMPSVFWPAELIFMGYMPNGQQLRVAWFKHATVNPKAPTRKHGFGQVPPQDS